MNNNENNQTETAADDRTIVLPHNTVSQTKTAAEADQTMVMKHPEDIERTVVSAAPKPETPAKNSAAAAHTPRKDETISHFSLFNLDHTWFQNGKDVNERIDRNRQANLDEVRLDSIHAFQETELFPVLANKDGQYEFIKKFNEGGQGIIAKVREKSLDRVVAMKSLRKELLDDESARRNFITEAKVSAQLEHPSIIPVYSLTGDEDKGLHLAMKLISGMTLTNYLEETVRHYKLDGIKNFDENKALHYRLDLFLRICDAMSYAHGHNIMHRDLKPENIIIGEYREVYIMDWGIATHIVTQDEDAEDGKKHVSGTPRFMAPEVIRGEAIDQRADVYALGLILFELVFLKNGYTGKTTQEIFGKVLRGECESFEHYFGWKVSPELAAIVKKAMHPTLAVRYQSVKELAQDLRRFLAGEETKAKPDTELEKVFRFIGKHRRLMAAVISGLLLLLLGLLAHNFYKQRNEQIYRVRFNRAMGFATTRMDDTAYKIETQMIRLENILRLFAEELEVRLKNVPEEGTEPALPPMPPEAAALEKGSFFSKAYNQQIDPNHLIYTIAPANADEKAAREEMLRLSPMLGKIRERFWRSDALDKSHGKTLEMLEKEGLEEGNPILWLYFGSENGLFLQYPRGSAMPSGYDPRKRPWYETGLTARNDNLMWSKPYLDAQTAWTVMTVTKGYWNKGHLVGVAAIDVILERFQQIMDEYGNNDNFTLGKYLIDQDGNILVASDQKSNAIWRRKGSTRDRKEILNIKEEGEKMLFAEMRWNDIGQITRKEKNRTLVFLHSKIRVMDWIYVEVIDLDKFIKENWDVLEDLNRLEKKLKRMMSMEQKEAKKSAAEESVPEN